MQARCSRGAGNKQFSRGLDTGFFYVHGIDRDDVDHVMDTSPTAKRRDGAKWGEYQTMHTILGIYMRRSEP
jgi:hypothetical protein